MLDPVGLTWAQPAVVAPEIPPPARASIGPGPTREPVNIGSDLQLFLDELVVERLSGAAGYRIHHPIPRETVLEFDRPWEGSGSGFHTVFTDGDIYKMYYRGGQMLLETGKRISQAHPHVMCYAESQDGITWTRPKLGLYEFNGSKDNNIVLANGDLGGLKLELGDNAVMFKDENPAVKTDERYKALALSEKPKGLVPLKSSDGIHWLPMALAPVITNGELDSHNVAFWDSVRREYRAYWRYYIRNVGSAEGSKPRSVRAIRTAVSQDFLTWTNEQDLSYDDGIIEHLYTGKILPYYRARQVLVGFPSRYIERGWSPAMRELPDATDRRSRAAISERYGTALSDTLLIASHDGVRFKKWDETFLRPGIEQSGTWAYGDSFMAWGIVEAKSLIKGAPRELAMYASEGYWLGSSTSLRRYTLRVDGFVSVSATRKGGELLTRPVVFRGEQLILNFSSSAAGRIRVEVQGLDGNPLPGLALDQCDDVFGDTLERAVTWNGKDRLAGRAGTPVRLRFVIEDADLYSFVVR